MFSYEVINSSTKSEVDLTSMEITVDTFRTILNYIYTSEIKLCEDNIQDMLQASDVFLLGRYILSPIIGNFNLKHCEKTDIVFLSYI